MRPAAAPARLPEWARKTSPLAPGARGLRVLLREKSLNTVCEEARCPNLGECFTRGTATFMLLGDRCTRRCSYCSVSTARPAAPGPRGARARGGGRGAHGPALRGPDLGQPRRPRGRRRLPLRGHRARRAARRCPGRGSRCSSPDFKGDREALRAVLEAGPEVFNHNIETVPRLFPLLRPQGRYRLSLEVLRAAKDLVPGQATKSGLMVGLGEADDEVSPVLADLRAAGVDIVTIGQYLRPTREHEPVHRYLAPAAFRAFEDEARAIGFPTVYSGVFVRSSFNAEEVYRGGGAR